MILLNKNKENIFSIYKSDFAFASTAGYTLSFQNDLTKNIYTTDLIYIIDNNAYTSIYVNDKGNASTSFNSSSGELILPLNGLYHLSIYDGLTLKYMERVFVKGEDNFIENTTTIYYNPDSDFSIINNNE
jgi:hypothetical protein